MWLNTRNSCPLCRYELPTDSRRYERYRQKRKEQEEKTKKERLEARQAIKDAITPKPLDKYPGYNTVMDEGSSENHIPSQLTQPQNHVPSQPLENSQSTAEPKTSQMLAQLKIADSNNVPPNLSDVPTTEDLAARLHNLSQ